MIAPTDELTPEQRTLQQLALRQLTAAAETMKRLQAIPSSQADREAVADALDWLSKADDTLRNWFGGCPAEFRADIEAAELDCEND
jgi:hypothetical protein